MTTLAPEQPMEQFAGMLAHELRNPLAAAVTNLAVACDLMEEGDPRRPFLERAEAEMDRLRVLLRSCIELARTGRVDRRRVNVGDLLAAVCDRAREQSPGLQFEAELQGEIWHQVDPDLVVRAIENLVENAARAMRGSSGRVLLTATVDADDHLVLEVADRGTGLEPELLERIFDPFVTGQKSSGLGLAFVKQVAVAHGGGACARNLPEGGACFTLKLPPGGEEIPQWLVSSS